MIHRGKDRRWGLLRIGMVCMCLVMGGVMPSGQRSLLAYEVVSTIAMIGDMAERIAGEHATVTTLIRSGVDPHLYNPTRSDVQQLQRADVVLYVGSLLEGRMSSVLDSLRARNEHIHSLIESISDQTTEYELKRQFLNDPHVWMDVSLWRQAAAGIAEALIRYDPAHRSEYTQNLAHYTEQLDRLERYAQEITKTIPSEKRILITAHDAFVYFGRAYGVRVEGIQGISTESEAGVRRIDQLADLIIEHDIGVIFVESSVNDKNVRALIEATRAQDHTLQIGGTLYSDAMGTAGEYEGTYIGMIDHNVTTIVDALGGTVPTQGMQGKLSK